MGLLVLVFGVLVSLVPEPKAVDWEMYSHAYSAALEADRDKWCDKSDYNCRLGFMNGVIFGERWEQEHNTHNNGLDKFKH